MDVSTIVYPFICRGVPASHLFFVVFPAESRVSERVWCDGYCADSAQTDLWRRLQQRGTAILHHSAPTGVPHGPPCLPLPGALDEAHACRRAFGRWCACLTELCLTA